MQHPELYDATQSDHKDAVKTANIWTSITSKVNEDNPEMTGKCVAIITISFLMAPTESYPAAAAAAVSLTTCTRLHSLFLGVRMGTVYTQQLRSIHHMCT